MTYLAKAKKLFPRFVQLMEEKGEFHQYESCTEQKIDQIEQFLDLLLPAAYREFLLWSGEQCTFMDEMGLPFYSSTEVDLRRIALDILNMNEAMDTLPEDAIVIVIFDETASFAFIRVSEGDNPPVHLFGPSNEEFRTLMQWNWFETIEELCLAYMKRRIRRVYLTDVPEQLLECSNADVFG